MHQSNRDHNQCLSARKSEGKEKTSMFIYLLWMIMASINVTYSQVPETFTTKRLMAERVTEKHISYILEILSNLEVQKAYGLPEKATQADALAQLDLAHGQWEKYGYGLYALFDKETSVFIGLFGFHTVAVDESNTIDLFDKAADTLELYGLLMPAYWRQGYGFEMGTKLIDLAFSSLPNTGMIAYGKPENQASLGLLKKLGFVEVGTVMYNNESQFLYRLDKPTLALKESQMDSLIPLYLQRLNLQDATFSRIQNDDAIVSIVYQIRQPNGTCFILKMGTINEKYLRELYFLKHLADKLPVPRVVAVVEPDETLQGAILMECLPGATLKVSDVTNELAYEFGTLLARIHLNRLPGYGDIIYPDKLILSPRKYFAQFFERGIDECSKHLPEELLQKCHDYYNANKHLLDFVDGPCMIHRDFRPGNVMIHSGKIQGIIDWETSRASFVEEDFRSMEHCWEWESHPDHKKAFLAGYASIRPVPDYDAVMPLLRLVRTLDTLGFTFKRGTWESSLAQLYQAERRFLDVFFSKS